MQAADGDIHDQLRALVTDVFGSGTAVAVVELVQVHRDALVVELTLPRSRRIVVKLCGPEAEHQVHFERTAMLTALANAAGAPVPEVLAADDSRRRYRWRYLVAEHIAGIPWKNLRPRLTPDGVASAHRHLAEALLAVQSLRFPSFGEIDSRGRPPADQTVISALRQRADSRILTAHNRETFRRLLDDQAHLFDAVREATLCHDDLHHSNVLFRPDGDDWRLVGVLDWDKAWAAPAESDTARMALWDDMTGPAFWQTYRATSTVDKHAVQRAWIYQLLWCFEYDDGSSRHAADTARLCRLLDVA